MIRQQISRSLLGLALGALSLGACDSADKAGDKAKTAAKSGAAKVGDAAKNGAEKVGDVAKKGAEKVGDAAKTAVAADKPKADEAAAEPSEAEILAALDKRVQRAAKLAREIEKKPEDADSILEAADLDREGFEALIYTIGADPGLSKQYQLAMADE